MNPNRPVQARPVAQPIKQAQPTQPRQQANINTLAAELFEIRKAIEDQARRVNAKNQRIAMCGLILMILSILSAFARAMVNEMLAISPSDDFAGLTIVAIVIGACLLAIHR